MRRYEDRISENLRWRYNWTTKELFEFDPELNDYIFACSNKSPEYLLEDCIGLYEKRCKEIEEYYAEIKQG